MKRWISAVLAVLLYVLAAAPAFGEVSEDMAALVDRYIEGQIREGQIPGLALAIVRDGKTEYVKGYGVSEGKRPVTPSTPFYICSVGKTFTALAVRQLAGEGKLGYDAPVTDYIPWFTLADPEAARLITIANLLSHTSGLSTADGLAPWTYNTAYSIEEAVRRLSRVSPVRKPGLLEEYSNLDYIILGLVVEKASGMAYGEYIQRFIFDRLGMSHSFTDPEAAKADGLAPGHMVVYGLTLTTRLPLPRAQVPAGFQMSSAEDMAKFAALYLTNGYAGGQSVFMGNELPEARAPMADNADGLRYGIYFTLESGEPAGRLGYGGHLGASSDYTSALLISPRRHTAVVVLANCNNGFTRPAVSAHTIANALCALLETGEAPEIVSLNRSEKTLSFVILALALLFIAYRAFRVRPFIRAVNKGRARKALAVSAYILEGAASAVLLIAPLLLFDVRWAYLFNSNPEMWVPVLLTGWSLLCVFFIKTYLLIRNEAKKTQGKGVN